MRVLDRKLLRDVRRMWSQSLAIALVLAVGVAILVMMAGAERALRETRDAFYERNGFAHVFATVSRAPRSLLGRIEAIEGVARAEGRISRFAILDIDGMAAPASGQLLSLPATGVPAINRPSLTRGHFPETGQGGQVVVNDAFATAHGFAIGSQFRAVINGRLRKLTIVGTALSPEFIYTIGPGSIMPDDRRFGVIWMEEAALAALYDLTGAFNDLGLLLDRDANVDEVIRQLDLILAPYGGTGAYLRKDQQSHTFLLAELTQLGRMVKVIPPIFLIISAFLVNMVLGRLVALEREQIGLLKALGYRRSEISGHYVKLALLIGGVGIALGWGGGLWAGRQIAQAYAYFFHFPYLVYVPYPAVYAISGLAGAAAAALGAVLAVRNVVALSPAVAMSPPAPPRYRAGRTDRMLHRMRLHQTTMMIWRSLTRWPMRAALTTIGIATSAAVMVGTLFMLDAMETLLDKAFVALNRQDAMVSFAAERPARVLEDVRHLPGVMAAEPVWSLPVRLRHGPHERRAVMEARAPGATLTRLLSLDGKVVTPAGGVLLSQRLAGQLDLRPGQALQVVFPTLGATEHELRFVGIADQSFGQGAYVSRETLARLTGQAPRATLVNLLTDPAERAALLAKVKATPAIAGVVEMDAVRKGFTDTIGENAGMMTSINSFLAALIAIGVVYNAARIQLSERARELASLRILGFTRGEVSYILLGELALLVLIAIPIGLFLGYGLAAVVVAGFDNDLFAIPLSISRETYFRAAWVVGLASIGSAAIVWRRIGKMDLISVMKTRE